MLDDLISENFRKREQTQSSNLLQHLPSSENQKIKLQQWSMVAIRDVRDDHDCSVFPPINHENLNVSLPSHQYEHAPESPSSSPTSCSSSFSSRSSFSPSDTDTWGPSLPSPQPPSESHVQKTGNFTGWMSIGLQILRSKVFTVVTSCRSFAARKGAVGSIAPLAIALITLWWMYTRVRRWLRRTGQTQREDHLMTIIKQKDEEPKKLVNGDLSNLSWVWPTFGIHGYQLLMRIAKLLHQIAQMNEILVAHHKALAAKLAD